MATDTVERLLTADEFLQLAEPGPAGVTLELIEGVLQERPMTTRSPRHSEAIIRIGHVLTTWLDSCADRAGVVVGGEARCRISTDPDTIVGIDVAYFEGMQYVELPGDARFYDGPPVLAVEVLSPSDTLDIIHARIRRFLAAGVTHVWMADPDFMTLTVYRSQAAPVMYSAEQEFEGGDDLPGFRATVAALFTGKRQRSL
jgi:Uma2 family endonuclease